MSSAAAESFARRLGTMLREDADEPVAGGMPQVVVDRLEPVQVHVQHRHRPGVPRSQPLGQMRDQCPTVVEPGQVVMLGQVTELLLRRDPRLQLREQRGHRLEGVDLLLLPLSGAEFDEAQHAGGLLPRHERGGRDRRRSHLLGTAAPALKGPIVLLGPDHHRLPAVLALRQHRVRTGEVHHRLRVGVRNIHPRRPFGDQYRGADVVVVMAQEAGVHVELLDELGQNPFTDLRSGGRGRLHQLGSYGSDDEVQAARQRVLRFVHVPSRLRRLRATTSHQTILAAAVSQCLPMRIEAASKVAWKPWAVPGPTQVTDGLVVSEDYHAEPLVPCANSATPPWPAVSSARVG